jgi:hypothetical protein
MSEMLCCHFDVLCCNFGPFVMGHVLNGNLNQLSGLHLDIQLQVPSALSLKVAACALVFDDCGHEGDAVHVLIF